MVASIQGFTPTSSRGMPSNNFYNAMVAPLAGISLAGAVYYQGIFARNAAPGIVRLMALGLSVQNGSHPQQQ